MTPTEFADFRRKLGITQSQLARELGIHYMTVSKYERGLLEVPRVVELALETLLLTDLRIH